MSRFALLLIIMGSLVLPIISVTYVLLRLPGRRKQLMDLFTAERILPQYLAMRGRQPKRMPDESPDSYNKRLRVLFDQLFTQELAQEYSLSRYAIPMVLSWITTAAAVFFLIAEGFGMSLRPNTPSPIQYAVLGAVFLSLWTVITRFAQKDLTPVTFLWIVFRYVLAIAYGLLAAELFTVAYANLGAFVVATLPFGETIRLLRSRLGGQVKWWTPVEGHPKLSDIQGLSPDTIEKLEELGVHATQELAFSDPLDLLLRSNFSPKVLIDWMDQAFLYNYVGETISQLRPRGIRGAIEAASLCPEEHADQLLHCLAEILKIGEDGAKNLVRCLYFDNHLQLIWRLWGVFEQNQPH